ncbi:MAG: cupin, partial [Rhodobacteraceae bacterium]
MVQKTVTLVKPGTTYLGGQGVTYSSGVSRKTT